MANEILNRVPTSGEICKELVEHMRRIRHLRALRKIAIRIERESSENSPMQEPKGGEQ